jgi:hypothetical protein
VPDSYSMPLIEKLPIHLYIFHRIKGNYSCISPPHNSIVISLHAFNDIIKLALSNYFIKLTK